MELRIDQAIDEIQLRLRGPLKTRNLLAEKERYRLDMLEESDQNHRFPFLMCSDLSANVDAGHAGVRAFIDTKIRHIPARSICKVSKHDQGLLAMLFGQDPLAVGVNLELDATGLVGRIQRGSLTDPIDQNAVGGIGFA